MAWDWDAFWEVSTVGGEIIGGLAGCFSITLCDATIVDTFETSTHNGLVKDGPWLHDLLFDTSTEGARLTSAHPGETLTVGAVLWGGSVSSGNDPVEAVIAIFIPFKNESPYARIEKRANMIYSTFHKKMQKKSKTPVLMATTKDAMDDVSKLFGNGGVGEMTETLSVLEGLLEKRKVQ